MSNIAEYGRYELDAADAEYEDLQRSGSGSFMKLSEGNNPVRFLPPMKGRRSPFVTVHQHFIRLPGRDSPIVFNCPRIMARQDCPACKKAEKLSRSPNPADQQAAKSFWPSRRVFAAVIDRKDEAAGPKILGFGKQIHESLAELRRDEDSAGDFTNPEGDGYDVVIQRTGMGKTDTRYKVRPARRSSPLGNMEWLGSMPDLQTMARVPSWDEIRQLVQGEPDAEATSALPPSRTAQRDVVDGYAEESAAPRGGFEDDDLPF